MKARDMVAGKKYWTIGKANGERLRLVEYSRPSFSGAFAIVHHPDEPDMQSCFGIGWDEEVEEATE